VLQNYDGAHSALGTPIRKGFLQGRGERCKAAPLKPASVDRAAGNSPLARRGRGTAERERVGSGGREEEPAAPDLGKLERRPSAPLSRHSDWIAPSDLPAKRSAVKKGCSATQWKGWRRGDSAIEPGARRTPKACRFRLSALAVQRTTSSRVRRYS
jgi:hypothetical protein